MCGIAGYINLNKNSADLNILKKMTNSIAHRGPDGEGHWVDRNIAIGHRRLAIIDLSKNANQPMNLNNNLVLSYNGEIYNFKEIRNELINLGHQFKSKSDSEVVLRSWDEWGEECVSKFNGMFAFALWDKKKNALFLVRDRYGIKPLYYAIFGDIVIFGSEQKAILSHPKVVKSLDLKAFVEYFTFQNIFTDRTLFKKIKLLKNGSILEIKNDKNTPIEIKTYWDYYFDEPRKPKDKIEYLEELDRLIIKAVNRQLVTDVELGSYLSGGMDSGTITSLVSQELPYIKTFTCGFDLSSASGLELTFDERQKAEAMSALFKSEHYQMVLKSGDMERCLPKLSYHLEEPRVGQSYPNYYAAQLASKFVKVVLSGAGGDELFGGYPWRYYRAAVNNNFDHYIDQYYLFWQRLIPNDKMSSVFEPIWSEIKEVNTKEIFKSVFTEHKNKLDRPEDYINHSLYFEAKTFLHGLFVVEDKISMSHSLETRVPFMDNELVDFAMKCPVSLKLNNLNKVLSFNENIQGSKKAKYFKKTKDGKQILREVMKKYVPDYITSAEKQGFSSPDASWFKGESIDYVKQILDDKNSNIYNIMNKKQIKQIVDEHLNGKKNRRLLIWGLLNIENWMKNYLK